MRKRILVVILVLLLIFELFSSYSFAANDPAKKLSRGLLNVAIGFLEIPLNIRNTGREDGFGMAVTYGAFKGAFYCIRRMIVGFYEMVTFPIPVPKGYEPILTDPEYFLDKEEEAAIK